MGSFELFEFEGDGDEEGGGELKRGNVVGFIVKDNGGGVNGGVELLVGVDVKDIMNLEVFIGVYIRDIIVSIRVVNISFFFFWKVLLFEIFIFVELEMVFRDLGVFYEF